jgi:hypothetical protein
MSIRDTKQNEHLNLFVRVFCPWAVDLRRPTQVQCEFCLFLYMLNYNNDNDNDANECVRGSGWILSFQ